VTRKAREILLLCLLAACLAFVLADSARFFVRLDVTRNRAYAISPVSGRSPGRSPSGCTSSTT